MGSGEVKTVSILGVTGTIGANTVDLIAKNKEKFKVKTIIAKESVDKLVAAAEALNPESVVINDESKYQEVKDKLSNSSIKVLAGEEDKNSACEEKVDVFISGAVGFCALEPTMRAIEAGSGIGLANKECLVCAGNLMMDSAKRNNAEILPIDSEHHSVFEVLEKRNQESIEKIILTASGGPFRNKPFEEFGSITPEMAVSHPNWDMGAKISVDSATMMNKGLEVIEAYYLFPVEKNQIDVVIHPQSIIHGMVCYDDGSVLAGMSSPDMRIPISRALGFPERLKNDTKRLDFIEVGELSFKKPNLEKYKCLSLARKALESNEKSVIALNAANEVAVNSFLQGEISFLEIANVNESTLEESGKMASVLNTPKVLGEIFEIDRIARNYAKELILQNKRINVA